VRTLYFADIRFPLERANGIQTMETCHALAARGHEVRLVVKPDTRNPPRDPFDFYGLPRIPSLVIERAHVPAGAGILQRVGYMSFIFGRAFGRSRADIIMTRDLGVAAALLKIPRGARAPLVYESHGYAPDVAAALPQLIATAQPATNAKLKRLAEREAQVWRNAEGYVTITGGLADELRERFGRRERLAVVPDGVRTVSGEQDALPRDPVIGYAGHLYAWKGVDVLLRAIARVPGASGLVVGGHEEEPDLHRVRKLASELGIADRVTFTGHVQPADVAGKLRQASILVLPNPASALSTRFTSPLKLFEYMAARRPIVATDLPSIREVLHDGQNALLVPSDDAGSMAEAIRRLLEDDRLAARLARNAADAVQQYTWARRAERLEALFSEVASSAT
jgi:glycosyltransferase involved in cell wall biosynthesis